MIHYSYTIHDSSTIHFLFVNKVAQLIDLKQAFLSCKVAFKWQDVVVDSATFFLSTTSSAEDYVTSTTSSCWLVLDHNDDTIMTYVNYI